jgi:hypothetical protein
MELTERQKAARTLGRIGGPKGGKARAAALSPERRREIAQNAVAARWSKSVIPAADPAAKGVVPVAPQEKPVSFKGDFFAAKTIDQLIAEQGVRPVTDISIFAGTIPDEDIDEFVADIYRDRRAE